MRLPYVSNPPQILDLSEEEIVDRILSRQGDRDLILLVRSLLHPPLATDGWNTLPGVIRTKTSLPTDLYEIDICRVPVINQASYKWTHHALILMEVGGFTEKMLAAVIGEEQGGRDPFNEKQWVVLRYADAMTQDVKVQDGSFEELRTTKC